MSSFDYNAPAELFLSKPAKGSRTKYRRFATAAELWLLHSYVWQNYDLYPDFPELRSFLGFWQKSLEGALHSVTVAHSRLVKPAEIKTVGGIFRLH